MQRCPTGASGRVEEATNDVAKVVGAAGFAARSLGRDDVETDREAHVAVQRCGDRVLADRLDEIDFELAALELDTGLG